MIGDVEEGREVVASMTTKPTLAARHDRFDRFVSMAKRYGKYGYSKERKEKRRWQGV